MLQTFIKEWLLQKKPKVYSIIADTYHNELVSLKPVLFRSWLSKELDIPEEKININSLYSALTRLRNKEVKQKQNNRSNMNRSFQQAPEQKFGFSSPSSEDKKTSRIKEM